MRGKLAPLVF
ncbi:47 kDa outer membrane protein, partial [Vibrio cholerae HC-52A1]